MVFMGLPLMLLGGGLARYEVKIRRIPVSKLILLWVFLRVMAFWECTYLYNGLDTAFNGDMSFFGMWPGLVLLEMSFRFHIPVSEKLAKILRKLSEYIYVFHPLVMYQINRCLEVSSIGLLLATIMMCSFLYVILEKQFSVNK